jgi:hypothetical protein
MTTALSKTAKDLKHQEEIIQDGMQHFLHVGRALIAIRDQSLYEEKYETFEAYCKQRWSISRPRAYQLIESAEVVSDLSTNGRHGQPILPSNERQTRALVESADTPEDRAKVWQAAVEAAPKNSAGEPVVTAKIVKAAAEELLGPPKSLDEQEDANSPKRESFKPEEFDPKLNPELPPTEVDSEKSLDVRIKEQQSIIEWFARGMTKWFDDNLPKDPWLDDSRVDIARDQVKSAASSIRLCKAYDKACPKCDGAGAKCKFCKGCGYLPKNSYEMAGGK